MTFRQTTFDAATTFQVGDFVWMLDTFDRHWRMGVVVKVTNIRVSSGRQRHPPLVVYVEPEAPVMTFRGNPCDHIRHGVGDRVLVCQYDVVGWVIARDVLTGLYLVQYYVDDRRECGWFRPEDLR